jgi:hypothetical protein
MNSFSSMHRSGCLLAGAALAAAAVFPSTAWAADLVEAPDGTEYVEVVERGVVIELGGGVQYLDLPDMRWTFLTNNNGQVERKQNNGDLSEYGGAVSGSAYIPLSNSLTLALSGFYTQAENSKRTQCESTGDLFCTVQNIEIIPNQVNDWMLPGFTTHGSRDVEYWGGSSELTFGTGLGVRPRQDGGFLFAFSHWGAGFNVRGIDQDNRIKLDYNDQTAIRYDETLDTTYYGGYLSVTGEFNILGYLGIGGNWNIRSFATFRGGVYGTDTDYTGRFSMEDQLNPLNTQLRLSDDEVAFIGSASFETRLPLSRRTSLSLVTDYEYFSYVPQMRYAAGQDVTRIDDDDMLAVRTQLRVNVGLGPDLLF